jgi:hypothetical protein
VRKPILLGIALFILFAIINAPASLIRTLTGDVRRLDLLAPTGSLWSGHADMMLDGHEIGRFSWSFAPALLIRARIGSDYTLVGPDTDLTGTLSTGFNDQSVQTQGSLSGSLVNVFLADYDLYISGDFDLQTVIGRFEDQRLVGLDGQLHWSGGDVTYILAGIRSQATLPGLIAQLDSEIEPKSPGARVTETGSQNSLLIVTFLPSGFVKIGVTKLLTKRLNRPWEGTDPDDGVVLEVEEALWKGSMNSQVGQPGPLWCC